MSNNTRTESVPTNSLSAECTAYRADLEAKGWIVIKPGDIAELRRTNTYDEYELGSFRTRPQCDPRGNVIGAYYEIWRRKRAAPAEMHGPASAADLLGKKP